MADFLKDFKKHSDYINYITGAEVNFWPNVSYCEDNNEVHYNPDPRLVCRYQSTADLKIYIDDFPTNIAEDEYDGDMASFKEDFMGDNIANCNEYTYTDETFEYGGEEYYLWEYTGTEDNGTVKYILTDTLDFTGKSLEDGINNDFCPFVYILGSDYEVTYTNEDHDDYWLVGVRDASETIKLFSYWNSRRAVNLFGHVEIDGISVSPQSLDENQGNYTFYNEGTHIVKYSLIDPTTIGESAFNNCTSLTSVTIGNSVTSIGNSAFAHSGLTSVTIPNSVTSIGQNVFYNCASLASVTIPDSVTSIGQAAFDRCTSLTSITIPNSVTSIGERAFYNCTSLTSVTIPNGVTSIGEMTFYGCNALTSVTIPDSVTNIGRNAFDGCTSLTSVTIPNGVTSIGQAAFYRCISLTSVTIEATTPPTLSGSVFDSTNNCPIYVPSESVNTYKAASGWSSYASRIQAIP